MATIKIVQLVNMKLMDRANLGLKTFSNPNLKYEKHF